MVLYSEKLAGKSVTEIPIPILKKVSQHFHLRKYLPIRRQTRKWDKYFKNFTS